jgi:hypothetical protein
VFLSTLQVHRLLHITEPPSTLSLFSVKWQSLSDLTTRYLLSRHPPLTSCYFELLSHQNSAPHSCLGCGISHSALSLHITDPNPLRHRAPSTVSLLQTCDLNPLSSLYAQFSF